MLITPAYAQSASINSMGSSFISLLLPMLAVMVVFWMFVLRPQQRKMRDHQSMLDKIGRGDTVTTVGGLIGKVVKVEEQELTVEFGENVKMRVLRTGISDVRTKGEQLSDKKK